MPLKCLGRTFCFQSGDLRPGPSMASTPRCGAGGASSERAIAGRQELMRLGAAADNMKLQQYLACRHTLASLLLAPAGGNSGQLDAGAHRTTQRDQGAAGKGIGRLSPALRELLESQRRPHTDLKDRLPINAVLVDTLRYRHFEQDANRPGKAGQKVISRYTAFIIAAGQPVRRVDSGRLNRSIGPSMPGGNRW